MKNKLLLGLILSAATMAAAITTTHAQTQTAAASDPVGYITIDIAGAVGGSPRLTGIAPTLVKETEFSGSLSGVAGTVLTVSGTNPLTAGAYDATDVNNPPYWLEVTTDPAGPLGAGLWTHILSNTASTITTAEDLGAMGVTANDTIVIRAHTTISDLFGAANEVGLAGGGNSTVADEIIMIASGGGTTIVFWFNSPGFEQWFTSGFQAAANLIIPPNQGLIVRKKSAGDIPVTFSGHVKTGPTNIALADGFNMMSILSPVGEDDTPSPVFTLATSNLKDYLNGGGTADSADEVKLFNPVTGGVDRYFYFNSPGFEQWFSSGFVNADNLILEEGTSVIVQLKTGGGTNYPHPAPQIAAP